MPDLEDTFLKSNVPGRYSTWTDDADGGGRKRGVGDDESETDGSEDDEFYFRDAPPSGTSPQPPPMRRTGNTGVKGVIADYNEARQRRALDEAEDRLERLEVRRGATRPAQGRQSPRDGGAADRGDGQHGSDDDDDEFVKNYRSRRISQLRANATLPSFGVYSRASPEEYCDLTDSIDPRCHLIVHLGEESILACRRLDSALDKLALSMPHAKFIRVDAMEANPNLDAICLPAVLVYMGGEMTHNLVRFTDELPREFTVEDVKEVLEGLGVVDPGSTDGVGSGR